MAVALEDNYAYAQRPDLALMTAFGIVKTLLVTEKATLVEAEGEVDYKGRLIIHATGYANDRERDAAYKFIQKESFHPEQAPENALLAWGKIKEIKEYNATSFAIDAAKHQHGDNLLKFQRAEGWVGRTVYGYELEGVHLLKIPIQGVTQQVPNGTFWVPENPLDMLIFKTAYQREAVNLDEVDG